MTERIIHENNEKLLCALSLFINNCPDGITEEIVYSLCKDCDFSVEQAYRVLLAGALDLYDDRRMMQDYLQNTVKLLSCENYLDDPYHKNILLDFKACGEWTVETKHYKPFELFVYNDLKVLSDGRIIPQVGFFDREYSFPCILQKGREWMMITPNEIETMKNPIKNAKGRVLTYGLGLGYFAYMASLKKEVESVTVVERDKNVTELFKKYILPQFEQKDKIRLVEFDALFFAAEQKNKKETDFDFVFADIWHDPSDGCDIYLLLKSLERTDCTYSYWIEDTIKCYL